MQSLGQSYANAINKRLNRVGPLFADRFQSKIVDDDSYLLHLSRYIHLNPVEAGLVSLPEEWEFSSYRDFIRLRAGTLPKADLILAMVGTVEKYRQSVIDGIGEVDDRIQDLLFDES